VQRIQSQRHRVCLWKRKLLGLHDNVLRPRDQGSLSVGYDLGGGKKYGYSKSLSKGGKGGSPVKASAKARVKYASKHHRYPEATDKVKPYVECARDWLKDQFDKTIVGTFDKLADMMPFND